MQTGGDISSDAFGSFMLLDRSWKRFYASFVCSSPSEDSQRIGENAYDGRFHVTQIHMGKSMFLQVFFDCFFSIQDRGESSFLWPTFASTVLSTEAFGFFWCPSSWSYLLFWNWAPWFFYAFWVNAFFVPPRNRSRKSIFVYTAYCIYAWSVFYFPPVG